MHRQLSHAIIDLLANQRRALHIAEIGTRLGVDDRAALASALDDLVYDGMISQRTGRRYRIAPDAKISRAEDVEGILHCNPRGFGFVKSTGAVDDVYVPEDALAGAMHRDRVRARVVAQTRRGHEGEIVEVLDRGLTRVVGVLRGRPGQRRLEPDDTRLRGPMQLQVEGDDDVEAGLAVVAELTRYPDAARESPCAKLVAVLGKPGEPDVEVAKVLAAHGIGEDHSPEAEAEAKAYGDAPDPAELARREDLTDVPLVTIDPHDARDHDDAIWVERDDDGRYCAWIAIADVSHYVRPGTALDAEALDRGCSVYLPDRAVPMLPHALSTRLCSLLPDVERLCLCLFVELDATGTVRRSRIIEGKMRSRAFLSYDAVARALSFTTEPKRDPKAEAMRHDLRVIWDLASLRRTKRLRRGALDLDVPEVRIAVDDDTRAPLAISQRSDDPGVRKAYRIVEEMMLLANEVVARHMLKEEIDSIYRIHGAPEPEKVERFAAACEALGVPFDSEDAEDPKRLSKFVRRLDSRADKTTLHGLLLRAMQQARYATDNIGHFGLASTAYLHFTSPIRRYPDLIVHRQLRGQHGDPDELRAAALRSSDKERNAMETEREVGDLYRAIYMTRHVGDRFEASVQAVTPGGVWVRIDEPFVSALISLDALGQDQYEADETGLVATGVRSGDRVALGDRLLVVIEDVSIVRRAVYARRVVQQQGDTRQLSKKERKRKRRDQARSARKGRKGGRGRGRK